MKLACGPRTRVPTEEPDPDLPRAVLKYSAVLALRGWTAWTSESYLVHFLYGRIREQTNDLGGESPDRLGNPECRNVHLGC